MPSQHPEEVGYGHVIESYVTRTYGGLPRYLVLNGGRFLGPRWWHTTRFTRHLLNDAAAIIDGELEALLGYEWRSRLTAAWLIGIDRRERFRERIGDLLLASEVCYSGSAYCFALARFGTHADAEILTAYLDHYLARTDLHYDQPAALGALLYLDARLGTHRAARFTQPDGLWDHWVNTLAHLRDHPDYTPTEQRRWTDLRCAFANGWTRPKPAPPISPAAYGALAGALKSIFWYKHDLERFIRLWATDHPSLLAHMDFSGYKPRTFMKRAVRRVVR